MSRARRLLLPVLLAGSLAGLGAGQTPGSEPPHPVTIEWHAPCSTPAPWGAGLRLPFAAGAHAFAASPRLNLRQAPSRDAAGVGQLCLGDEVTVLEVDPACGLEDGVPSHWVRVAGVACGTGTTATGFVFGGFLTPARVIADFDGRPGDEVATVAWAEGRRLQVRFRLLGDPDGEVASLEVASARGRESERTSVRLVPRAEAGTPLLRLDSADESCGPDAQTFVSCLGQKRPRARIALDLRGHSDPPSGALVHEVAFEPAQHRATVKRTEIWEEAGEEKSRTSVARYRFEKGVFRALGR